MPIGSQVIYNAGDLILSVVSSSGNTFRETKINAATSSFIYFDNTATLTSASLNSITAGNAISASWASSSVSSSYALTASYVVGIDNAFIQNGNSFGTTATLGTNDNQPLVFETNGTERIKILANGYVGIGSSSPTSRLEVLAPSVALASQPNIIGNFRGDTDGRSLIRVENINSNTGAAAAQAGISFILYSTSSNQPSSSRHEAQIILGSTSATSVGQAGTLQIIAPLDIAFNVSSSNTIMTGSSYGVYGSNAMYISRTGNVGIGTISPNALLELSSSTASTLLNVKGGVTNGILYVSGSSQVGVNTTTPYGAFEVNGDPSAPNRFITISTTSTSGAAYNGFGLNFRLSDVSQNLCQIKGAYNGAGSGGSASMIISTRKDGTLYDRFTILYDGSVGIGIMSPTKMLDVSGSARFGSVSTDKHEFTGSVNISGSLTATSSSFQYNETQIYIALGAMISPLILAGQISASVLTASLITASEARIGRITSSGILVNGDLTVTGSIFASVFSSSNIYITSSQLVVTDNILTLNALSPYQRYAGIEMYDSGSGTKSSLLWDGGSDYFFITGSGVNGKLITGPDGQTDLTANYIPRATAGYKLGDSVIYQSGSNIGIGTTNPAFLLDVSGSSRHGFTSTNVHQFTGSINLNGSLFTNANITASNISASGTGSFGIVGIGTSSPSVPLHVVGQTYINNYASLTSRNILTLNVNGSNYAQIYDTGLVGNILALGGAATVTTVPSTPIMSWDLDDNRVGIGTSTPRNQLTVIGPAQATSAITDSGNTGGTIFIGSSLNNVDQGGTLLFSTLNDSGSYLPQWGIKSLFTNGAGNGVSDLAFSTRTTGSATALTERVRFRSDGTVGIGTTAPRWQVEVFGTNQTTANITDAGGVGGMLVVRDAGSAANNGGVLGFGTAIASGSYVQAAIKSLLQDGSGYGRSHLAFSLRSAGTDTSLTERVRILSDGSVGIGTTSPGATLDVYGASAAYPTGSGTTQTGNIIRLRNNGSDLSLDIGGNSSNGNWLQSTNNTDLSLYYPILINPRGGSVGIGTTSPSYKLDVYQTTNDAIIRSKTSAAGAYVYLDTGTAGYVGVNMLTSGTSNWFLGLYGGTNDFLITRGINGTEYVRVTTTGRVGIGTSNPAFLLDVSGSSRHGYQSSDAHQFTGSVNISGTATIGGSVYNKSVEIDKMDYFQLQPYIEAGNIPSNVLQPSGTSPTFTTLTGSDCPFGKVSYNTSYYEAVGDYIPVNPGETLYGEIWAYRSSGATGTAGVLYCGIARYDKNKNPLDSNLGLTYFIASAVTIPSTSTWTKYSGTTTLPLTHTPYGSSDGGPVRYIRPYIIVDYPSGTIPTYWGAFKIRKVQITRDVGIVSISGSVGIGTDNPGSKLSVYGVMNASYPYDIGQLSIASTETASINRGSVLTFAGPYSGSLITTWASIGGLKENSTQNDYAAYLAFFTRPQGNTNQERLRITSTGNVGIGTNNPTDKLQVLGSITAGANTSTNGTTLLKGFYGNGNLTVLGTEYASGGAMLGYAVTPSTGSTGAFFSSTGINIGRVAYLQNGGSHRWFTGAVQTVTIGDPVSLSEVMRITVDGNVGIGTTLPTARLNVASTSQTTKAIIQSLSAATGLGGYLAFNPGGDSTYSKVAIGVYDNYYSSYNRGNLAFMINSAANGNEVGFSDTKMYISASGNVGIGTTDPNSKLHVNSSGSLAAGSVVLRIEGTSGSLFSVDDTLSGSLMSVNDITGLPILEVFSNDTVVMGTYNANTLVVTGSRVGIGTNSPAYSLDNSGSSRFGSTQSNSHYFTGSVNFLGPVSMIGGYNLYMNNNNIEGVNTINIGDPGPQEGINWLGGYYWSIFESPNDFSNTGGNLQFVSGSGTVNVRRLTLNLDGTSVFPTGSVGIGTDSPSGKLDIRPDSSWLGSEAVIVDTDGGNNPRIKLYRPDGGSPTSSYAIHLRNDSGNLNILSAGTTGNVIGSETVTSRVYINTSGNVGIGTTSPVARLHLSASGTSISLLKGVNYNNGNASFNNASLEYYDTSTSAASTVTKTNYSAYFNKRGTAAITGYTVGNFNAWTQIDSGSVNAIWDYTSRIEVRSQATASSLYHYVADSGYVTAQGGVLGMATDRIGFYVRTQNQSSLTLTNQYGVYIEDLGGSTNNYGIYSNLSSGAGKYNIYAAGTANNYFAGNVGVGTTSPGAKFEISGSSNSVLMQIKSPISGALVYISGSGNIGIGTSTPAYNLQVIGSFAATTKSFLIDHPTKEGKKLVYGSLESPYHGIRLTGKGQLSKGNCKVELPDYISKLARPESVNIQLTGIKCPKTLYIDEVNVQENYFIVAYEKGTFEFYKDYEFFWDFTAIRSDVAELQTEI